MTSLKFWKGASYAYDRILTVILVLILLIVGYCMYDNYWVYSHTLDDRVLRFKPTAEGYDPDESPITEDMVGWLTIDDTNIDYPVMQGEDNVKYLNTDPFGAYSLSGSIFLDNRNSSDFSDRYSLIYGHHMEYGKMFGALDDFLDEEYLKSHSKGELLVGRDGSVRYDLHIFASMRAGAHDKEVFNVGESGTLDFIRTKAEVMTEGPRGRIVALSTCANSGSVSRILVFCYIEE
ncbi:class B sortase [Ruminococcus sp.]|uniref:class B sortase n=1 Tax=Ruminococcus sp. TaxID=41978 RepID=UPI0025D23DAE|nr:class B sortase [Ruminococcus sp.]MBQ8967142.1 class B sortase [Ruminococcus sp.]